MAKSDVLTCPSCGNTRTWVAVVRKRSGKTTATCGACGTRVKTTGGTSAGTVHGGMWM